MQILIQISFFFIEVLKSLKHKKRYFVLSAVSRISKTQSLKFDFFFFFTGAFSCLPRFPWFSSTSPRSSSSSCPSGCPTCQCERPAPPSSCPCSRRIPKVLHQNCFRHFQVRRRRWFPVDFLPPLLRTLKLCSFVSSSFLSSLSFPSFSFCPSSLSSFLSCWPC